MKQTAIKGNGHEARQLFEAGGRGIIGIRGLKNLAGRINEEYLAALKTWSKESKIYTEMIDDVIVGTLLDAVKLPLLAAEFAVDPAPAQGEGDKQAAEWLEKALDGMYRQAWEQYVTEAVSALEWGFSIGEIVLEKRSDGRLWPRNIEPRGQETLEKWEFDEHDQTTAFIQRDPDHGILYTIPLEKCVHIVFRGRKGNPQGRSILRSIYRPWRFCKDLENLEAIGIERDVGGMPVAVLPEGDISSADITSLKDALKSLRNDEASYLITPPGVTITPYGGGTKMYDVSAVIERKQKEILGRLFAQFLKLGMDKVGSQALVKGSQDFFMLALRSVQETITQALNQQLVPYLFSYNDFPGMTGLPSIFWHAPGKVDTTGLIASLKIASEAKLFTPTDEDEDEIRTLLDWPELPEDERGIPREVEKPPAFEIKMASRNYAGGFDPSEHPRDDDGKWAPSGGGKAGDGLKKAGDQPLKSPRAERARATHKTATAEVQRSAEANEAKVTKAISGQRTTDNEAFDVVKGNHAVEVKTIVRGTNDKITMHPESLRRKKEVLESNGLTGHTVVIDDRPGGKSYYAPGVGSFRLSNMTPLASLNELGKIIK